MHRRRRTALSVSAALLAAAPLLTACGGGHPGAAAVVGGERIETAALQSQVQGVRSAQEASPQAERLIRATGDLGRRKLSGMIFDRVVEKVAADAGITVSRKEVQQTRRAAARQYGGDRELVAMLLQQQGTAPGEVDGAVRREVLMSKIAERYGAAGTPEGQKKLTELFGAASRDLGVEVNPRYGTWDHDRVQLGHEQAPWLRQVTRDPAGAPTGL
ncbi:SurA N-terminal domain-containing protein [Streptomyces somaliensis]|uniref:SurA N-terminal domain-containing protein n=1 Tax=Streptomyces somaliensis TaxID=78355 RepID=UPI0020CDD9D2|nr:SurA N-terminal domain-containing protein [Streptomyces somaliensis]MCP9944079.1 SurA N-terminal domain-containing protein [Streptomyces somaliensis]MCP9962685.1 SurA N-terminal domain-containing protein [Streptomyces somaliensis]MCP9975521.1 SurA N-terminal domain-containing protein [Streptomyces somaliensis]